MEIYVDTLQIRQMKSGDNVEQNAVIEAIHTGWWEQSRVIHGRRCLTLQVAMAVVVDAISNGVTNPHWAQRVFYEATGLISDGLLTAAHITNRKSRSIDISLQQLTEIPESVFQMDGILELDLSGNRLADASNLTRIAELDTLEVLYLNGNGFTDLPSEFGQLKNLKGLHIMSNEFETVPECVWQMTNLHSLSMSYNFISEIPADIARLVNLVEVDWRECGLTSIAPEIGQLRFLEELDLDHNALTTVPSEIGNLSNMRRLSLYDNLIDQLPEGLSKGRFAKKGVDQVLWV